MRRHRVMWIVIADGSRARIVAKRAGVEGYEVVATMDSPEAHEPSHLIGGERLGRSQESQYSARHAIEPRHDPHQERLAAFVNSVAAFLNERAAGHDCDELILFAPARALGQLRRALDEAVVHKIRAQSPKDLTKLPLDELPAHVAALLSPQ